MVEYNLTELATKAILGEFAKSAVLKANSLMKGLGDEIKHVLDNGLYDYLDKQKQKLSYIKTILHTESPVYIYEIYQPLKLVFRNKGIETDRIENLFENSNFITILGHAGSGKTTLIKHLFLNTICTGFGIPILIEFREFNNNKDCFKDYISTKIFKDRLSPNNRILERMLDAGLFVFFLDGFDELNSSIKGSITAELQEFTNKYSENKYIMTSRPYSDVEAFENFFNYKIKKLDMQSIRQLVVREAKEDDAKGIINVIESNTNKHINSFISNPLLLSLFILTYRSYPSLPKKISIFYGRVVDVLVYKHDSLFKPGFKRELHSKLSQDDYINLLKKFSYISYFQEKFEFETDYVYNTLDHIKRKFTKFEFSNSSFIEDMLVSISLWIEDGGKLTFAHRSLQEYFAARYINELDSVQKEKAFIKVRKATLNRKNNNSRINFLKLCEDIDNLNYYSLYAIPLLKELLIELEEEDLHKNVNALFTLYNLTIKLERNGANKIDMTLNYESDIFSNIPLENIGSVYQIDFLKILNKPKIVDYLEKKYKSILKLGTGGKIELKALLQHEKFFRLLIDGDLPYRIDTFIRSIKKIINRLESIVKDSLEGDESILDLIEEV